MGVGGRPSIINVIRGRKRRCAVRDSLLAFLFLFLSSRRVLARIPSARILFGILATSEKPPKGSLGTTKRDVIHHSPVHCTPFLTLQPELRCHSRGIKFGIGSKTFPKLHRVSLSSLFSQDSILQNNRRGMINVLCVSLDSNDFLKTNFLVENW